jgi:hypothetical protein
MIVFSKSQKSMEKENPREFRHVGELSVSRAKALGKEVESKKGGENMISRETPSEVKHFEVGSRKQLFARSEKGMVNISTLKFVEEMDVGKLNPDQDINLMALDSDSLFK